MKRAARSAPRCPSPRRPAGRAWVRPWPVRRSSAAGRPTGWRWAMTPRISRSPRAPWPPRRTRREVGRCSPSAAAQGVPMTFRSGGTSLSGQGVHRRHPGGHPAALPGHRDPRRRRPGADRPRRDGAAGQRPAGRLGRKLGPDPASEIACTLGGVVANNSSGMACGTVANTYNTLDSLVLVLPSGTVIDTGAADADERLRSLEPELLRRAGPAARPGAGQPGSVRHRSSSSSR